MCFMQVLDGVSPYDTALIVAQELSHTLPQP